MNNTKRYIKWLVICLVVYIVSVFAHECGHGLANAILLPTVMRYNGEVCSDEFKEILVHIGRTDAENLSKEDIINTFVWELKDLSAKVGITQTLRDVGCKGEDLEMLADKARLDPCKPGNPRPVTKEDFINLYREAM